MHERLANFISIFEIREHEQKHKKGHRNLVVCTWNVQTLVEKYGDVPICRRRQVSTGHGLDERNVAGEELLQFCAVNLLTVINT